ncbi:HSP20-like chaperone [Calocera viscosa TUFC12733]|uniref:HSP20-like chaperone n=1 Tax=Calocera viscosa (strain TUFC12733) TaxID=1330018 RepID=A0A167QDS6_CALVF|nr:HSP20-like chaperone [Calocera viscosa TUFC12733]
MASHPQITWAQRSSETVPEKNILYVTIDLPDIIEGTLKLDLEEDSISFKARAGNAARGLAEKDYEFKLDFYAPIVPEETQKNLSSRHLALKLRKKDAQAEFWPRLTKEKVKTPWMKTDFSKWVDEDEQDAAADPDDFSGMDDPGAGGMPGMGGMGGMPGMGGMGGMPGMGGMGGMPGMGGFGGGMPGGADFNFEEMMAKINAGGAGGAEGAEDDDDDEEDGIPPLEEVPATSSTKTDGTEEEH